MNAEQSGEFKICPYWRKYVQFNGYILALCGSESSTELPLTNQGEESRLPFCPWFDVMSSYENPMILEYDPKIGKPDFIIDDTGYKGRQGIEYLEKLWDQQVMEFIQRHSQ